MNDELVSVIHFQSLVGSLHYLASTTPAITYGAHNINKFMETPRKSTCKLQKRFWDVKDNQNYGIFYSNLDMCGLIGYAGNWADNVDGRKRHANYTFHIGLRVISWSSK